MPDERRMSQLDGLRALAVLAVFVQHWGGGLPDFVRRTGAAGSLGVQLFFVLSGFLITGILLRARNRRETLGQGTFFTIKQFYIRRFLRIFPLYYAFLIVLGALGLAGMATAYVGVTRPFWWHALYLTNVYVVHHNGFPPVTGHFWTLAVEEQFYIVWPWLVLLLPGRWLKAALATTVVLCLGYRLIGIGQGWGALAISRLTPSCLNSLGGGALLAYFVESSGLTGTRWRRPLGWLAAAGLPCMIGGYVLGWPDKTGLGAALLEGIGVPTVLGWVVVRAAEGFSGVIGGALSARPMVYLGRISYGLYVIHFIVPGMWGMLSEHVVHIPEVLRTGVIGFGLYGVTAVVLASLSWRYFESPLNRLKKRFPYQQPQPAAARVEAGEAAARMAA